LIDDILMEGSLRLRLGGEIEKATMSTDSDATDVSERLVVEKNFH
jgi:hypothetical protein